MELRYIFSHLERKALTRFCELWVSYLEGLVLIELKGSLLSEMSICIIDNILRYFSLRLQSEINKV